MSIEPAPEQAELSKEIVLPFPRSWMWRVLYGLFVLVMPILAFWGTELFLPDWQNGEFSSYIILLLSPKASWGFYPLLAVSIVSYLSLLTNFARYSQEVVIRLGIYIGVLLALQFSILSGLFMYKDSRSSLVFVIVWLLPILVSRIYPWAVTKWDARRALLGTIIFVIVIIVGMAIATSQVFAPFFVLLAGLTIASPFWCFLLFLKAAIVLFKNHETQMSPSHGLGLTALLGGYVMACRFSILQMYELYNALPLQPPPDCYIATAAAQGHPKIVDTGTVVRADGSSLRVNQQLQILKCAELALLAISPRLHKLLREIYDVLGRSLAQRIRTPFVADMAYLLLKPFVWVAKASLKVAIPEIETISRRMYSH